MPQLQQYQYYSTGLLSNHDKYSEKSVIASKAKRDQKRLDRKYMKGFTLIGIFNVKINYIFRIRLRNYDIKQL